MKELILFFISRIKRDDIALHASSLTFTSILALIPAMTIVVSVFAMVPSFSHIKAQLEVFVKDNFMPVFSESVSENVARFVAHAGSLTVTSTVALIVVSLLLIRAIDNSLNRIWRGGKRRIGLTFSIYWTLLTVGPLALGLLLYLFTKILDHSLTVTEIAGAVKLFYFIFPILIEIGILATIYMTVPVATVKLKDAISGAVITTIIFEFCKKLFASFILNFSDYEAIYGALAALPVLMIWIYINWWIVLLGAEFTACLGLVREGQDDNIPKLIQHYVAMTGPMHGSYKVVNKKRNIKIKVSSNKNQQP